MLHEIELKMDTRLKVEYEYEPQELDYLNGTGSPRWRYNLMLYG